MDTLHDYPSHTSNIRYYHRLKARIVKKFIKKTAGAEKTSWTLEQDVGLIHTLQQVTSNRFIATNILKRNYQKRNNSLFKRKDWFCNFQKQRPD